MLLFQQFWAMMVSRTEENGRLARRKEPMSAIDDLLVEFLLYGVASTVGLLALLFV